MKGITHAGWTLQIRKHKRQGPARVTWNSEHYVYWRAEGKSKEFHYNRTVREGNLGEENFRGLEMERQQRFMQSSVLSIEPWVRFSPDPASHKAMEASGFVLNSSICQTQYQFLTDSVTLLLDDSQTQGKTLHSHSSAQGLTEQYLRGCMRLGTDFSHLFGLWGSSFLWISRNTKASFPLYINSS